MDRGAWQAIVHGGTVLEAPAYYVPPLLGKVIKPLFPFRLKKGKEENEFW